MKAAIAFVLLLSTLPLLAQTPAQSTTSKPYVIEYYYTIEWGHADEFKALFLKNHYPVLKRQVEMGRMLSVKMEEPVYHMTEDARWDYRVAITFKDAAAATTHFDEEALKKELFPDQVTFKNEERRRFEILLAHWDLPIRSVELK